MARTVSINFRVWSTGNSDLVSVACLNSTYTYCMWPRRLKVQSGRDAWWLAVLYFAPTRKTIINLNINESCNSHYLHCLGYRRSQSSKWMSISIHTTCDVSCVSHPLSITEYGEHNMHATWLTSESTRKQGLVLQTIDDTVQYHTAKLYSDANKYVIPPNHWWSCVNRPLLVACQPPSFTANCWVQSGVRPSLPTNSWEGGILTIHSYPWWKTMHAKQT